MNRLFSFTVILVFVLMLLPGCGAEVIGPSTPVDTTVVVRSDIRADSALGFVYYSIDGDSIVPPDSTATSAWDIRLSYLRCCGNTRNILIRLNSGNAGVGSTKGAVIASRFENLSTLPAGTTLRNDDTLAPVIMFVGIDPVWVYQGAPNHTLAPSPDKIIAIKTRKGRLVKFQFTSIYEGAPATPTQASPIGFYHFRYANLRQ